MASARISNSSHPPRRHGAPKSIAKSRFGHLTRDSAADTSTSDVSERASGCSAYGQIALDSIFRISMPCAAGPRHGPSDAASGCLRTGSLDVARPALHQQKVLVRDWTRLLVLRAVTNRKDLDLPLDGSTCGRGRTSLALRRSAFVSVPSKQSFSYVDCPIFTCRTIQINGSLCGPAALMEFRGRLRHPPAVALPLYDLVGIHLRIAALPATSSSHP